VRHSRVNDTRETLATTTDWETDACWLRLCFIGVGMMCPGDERESLISPLQAGQVLLIMAYLCGKLCVRSAASPPIVGSEMGVAAIQPMMLGSWANYAVWKLTAPCHAWGT